MHENSLTAVCGSLFFFPIPSFSVGQKESNRLLRHCGSKSDGVAGIGGVAGGASVRGLAHAPRDGKKAYGGLEDSSPASTKESTTSVSFSESSSRTRTLAIPVLLIGGCRSAGELSVTEKGLERLLVIGEEDAGKEKLELALAFISSSGGLRSMSKQSTRERCLVSWVRIEKTRPDLELVVGDAPEQRRKMKTTNRRNLI